MGENENTKADVESFMENMEKWGLTFHARKNFKKYVDELSSDAYQDSEIFSIIDEIVLNENADNQLMKCLSQGTLLYRAREIDVKDYSAKKGLSISDIAGEYTTFGYNVANSIEAPLDLKNAQEGRNNIKGVSYLYVANNPETACAEVKSSLRSLVSLAEFEIKKEMTIIDFSQDVAFESKLSEKYNMSMGVFFTSLMSSFTIPDTGRYRFTQVVSDYLRKFGVDGIAYRSFYTGGINYTIFNSHKSRIEFKKSRILSHQFSNDVFWDFNNQCILETVPDKETCKYDKDVANGILSDMKKTFSAK